MPPKGMEMTALHSSNSPTSFKEGLKTHYF